jgi:translation initiation factor IF-3
MILFRGREQSRPDQGVRLLKRFAEDVSEFGTIESSPTIDGRNMVMVIGPLKTKATAKAEAEARRVANKPAKGSTADATDGDTETDEVSPEPTEAVPAETVSADDSAVDVSTKEDKDA